MRTATSARVHPTTFDATTVRGLHAMNARVCRDLAADPHRRPRPGIDLTREQLLISAARHDEDALTAGPLTLWFWTYAVPGVGSTSSGGCRSADEAIEHMRKHAAEDGVALLEDIEIGSAS